MLLLTNACNNFRWIFTICALMTFLYISQVKGKITKPNLKTRECLKTSHYLRIPDKFVCKDLGLCYKYYCQMISRRCSSCKKETTKCSIEKQVANGTKKEEKSNLFNGIRQRNTSRTLDDSSLVSIKAGHRTCAGFLASFPSKKKKIPVLITAANCVMRFSVRCERPSSNNPGIKLQDVRPNVCFGWRKSVVTEVDKGFRSYCATIEHKGRSVLLPLNSQSALVPREYVECGDCRFDFAVLRLTATHLSQLNISSGDAYLLDPKVKAELYEKEAEIEVQSQHTPRDSRSALEARDSATATRHGGVISLIQKLKFCLQLHENESQIIEDEMAGNPVFLTHDNELADLQTNEHDSTDIKVVGVVTDVTHNPYRQLTDTDHQHQGHSVSNFGETGAQPIDENYVLSVVRVTDHLLDFVSRWLKKCWKTDYCGGSCEALHPRYDCFPSFYKDSKNETLCVCSRGWTSERNFCNDSRDVSTFNCKWNDRNKTLNCDQNKRTSFRRDTSSYRMRPLDQVVVPGSTQKLSLISNEIQSGAEMGELLRHLPSLESLMLDNNKIQRLPRKFSGKPYPMKELSLERNNITMLRGDSLRKYRYLQSLSLAGNHLVCIKKGLLRAQKELRILNLADNAIDSISRKAFRKIRMLRVLKLSHNRLQSLNETWFKTNHGLVELWLDHNQLESIPARIFSYSPCLTLINLEGNRLTWIPRDLFRFNVALVTVKMNNNSIASLPNDLFDNQQSLQLASFHNNPDLPSPLTFSAFVTHSSINRLRYLLDRFGRQPVI